MHGATVNIKTNHTKESYPCYLAYGLLDRMEDYLDEAKVGGQKVLVVDDSNTSPLYFQKVRLALQKKGYEVAEYTFTAGEGSKNKETLEAILDQAFAFGLGREDKMLALGGGVSGDLTGFAAAIYMRGISYIQVPTTVLAQVDSSVGGKTGIDTAQGKNLIGAFKQPEKVLIDLKTLETLPEREVSTGMAEIIKYGLLEGEPLLSMMRDMSGTLPNLDLIQACIEAKARIVSEDTLDRGSRAVLNLGHTLGHAIEKATGYGRYTHGEAVGIGLLGAVRIGEILGLTPSNLMPDLICLLQDWNLPTYTDVKPEPLLKAMAQDKKKTGRGISYVLLEKAGRPVLHMLSFAELEDLLKQLDGFCIGVDDAATSIEIRPSGLKGVLYPPPSKSMGHRLLMAVALAQLGGATDSEDARDFTTFISNYREALSDDIRKTTEAFRQILQAASSKEPITIDCGESGSTIRFLIPIVAALGLDVRFEGQGRLPVRPLDQYDRTLTGHGPKLAFPEEEGLYLPLEVTGKLQAGHFEMAGDVSSQYITGMLYALCLLDKASVLSLTTVLESAPYVDLTLDVLKKFGQDIQVEEDEDGLLTYRIRPVGGFKMPADKVSIERDFSQSAFWYLARFLGQDVDIQGMDYTSLQGDKVFASCLQILENRQVLESSEDIAINVSQCPDLFPALGVASAMAGEGKWTYLVDAGRLRIKESDRLAATQDMLERLGVETKMGEDYLGIKGVAKFRGAALTSYGDHRLAMAGTMAALVADGPSTMEGASAIKKSYPAFYREVRRLGGDV